jgi:uracil-DNA glycosylase
MRPLSALVAQIRVDRAVGHDVPFFDPCDGGIQARILFLLEAPGPQAVRTGFISRDNPDPSARNLRQLLTPLPRHETVLWNIVPWYVGTSQRIAPVSRADLTDSRPYLEHLIRLLPAMVTAVLVGKTAQQAREDLAQIWRGPVVEMWHPSNRVFNRWPTRRGESEARIRLLAEALVSGRSPGSR